MGAALGIFLASLAGSPHCAAMCGPFVAFYAGTDTGSPRPVLHVAYSLGRLAAYLALGLAAGALGAGVDRLGALAGVARVAAIVAGVDGRRGETMLALRRRLSPARATHAARPRPACWRVRLPVAVRATVTGLHRAPCGWLYARAAAVRDAPWRAGHAPLLDRHPARHRAQTGWRPVGPSVQVALVTATAVVAIGLLSIGRLRVAADDAPAYRTHVTAGGD